MINIIDFCFFLLIFNFSLYRIITHVLYKSIILINLINLCKLYSPFLLIANHKFKTRRSNQAKGSTQPIETFNVCCVMYTNVYLKCGIPALMVASW